jgi:anti-sigma factor ChrR (cupin superfamily)
VTRKPKLRAPQLVVRALELATKKSGWERLRHGIKILRLCGDPRSGPSVALLRYQPGANVPAHRHPGFEVIYVLEGAQSDERGTYPAGTLVVNREGVGHSVWSERGCLVLVAWELPVEFL